MHGDRHEIRLRGPWQVEPVCRTVLLVDGSRSLQEGPLPAPAQVHVPCDWGQALGGSFGGQVRFLRSFGCPSGLAAGDRVELVLEEVDAWADVWLNERKLGHVRYGVPGRFEIHNLLRPRNSLLVLVEKPTAPSNAAALPRPDHPGGILGEVRLVIRPASR